MELRHLRYFLVAGEEQHFSRAAGRLHLSQPALSQQIRELETELGFNLFERLSRGVRLTHAGQVFLDRTRRILDELDDACERSRHAERGEVGRLRVGFNEVAGQRAIVGQALHLYRQQFPNVELDLVEMNTFQQLDAFRTDAIDLGFQYNQEQNLETVQCLRLRVDHYALAIPAFHRWAGKKRILPDDLKEEPLVWLARSVNPLLHDTLMAFLHQKHITPRIVQEAKSEASLMNLVSVGMGSGIVVRVPRMGGGGSIVLKPIAGLDLPLYFSVAWRAGDGSPLVANFVRIVRSLAPE